MRLSKSKRFNGTEVPRTLNMHKNSSREGLDATMRWMSVFGVRNEVVDFIKASAKSQSSESQNQLHKKKIRNFVSFSKTFDEQESLLSEKSTREKFQILFEDTQTYDVGGDIGLIRSQLLSEEVMQYMPKLKKGRIVMSEDFHANMKNESEPFRPAATSVKQMLRKNLYLLNNYSIKKQCCPNLFDRLATSALIFGAHDNGPVIHDGEVGGKNVVPDVHDSLRKQVLENAIGRHLESVVEGALQLVLDSLKPDKETKIISWEQVMLLINGLSSNLRQHSDAAAIKVNNSLPYLRVSKQTIERTSSRICGVFDI